MTSEWIQLRPSEPDDEESSAPQMAIAGGQSYEFNGGTGEVKVAFSQAETVADSIPGRETKGILATARTPFGSPARELKPDTRIDIEGTETTLAVAESLGLVRRDELGRYVETTAAERKAAEPEVEKTEALDQPVPFSAADEAELANLVKDAPKGILGEMFIEGAIRAAKNGAISVNVEEVVSRTGMSMEAATRFVGKASGLLQAQATAELKKANVDPQEFLAWAMEHRPNQLRTTFVNHVNIRSLAGYREMAKDYLRSVVPDADSLAEGGSETKVHGQTGELLVKIDGTWMSAAVAARFGYI